MEAARTSLIRNNEDRWNIVFAFLFILLYGLLCVCLFWLDMIPYSLGILDFFLLILGTYRLIRLFTFDKITDFIRDYFRASTTSFGKVFHSLLVCHWCTGMWAALFLVTLYVLIPGGWIFLLVLSVAGAASFLQNLTHVSTRYAEKNLLEQRPLERDRKGKEP